MAGAKDKIIALWLHIWLKRIAKRYPDFFEQILKDVIDSDKAQTIMRARYLQRLKFKQIPDVVNLELRQVYKIHQDVIKHIINL
ncbi:MAG: hypothetical protein J6S67_22380 [Methanobrevibacter sp.]|nr:hypothetical protein [Methanobrevibacter sp.]